MVLVMVMMCDDGLRAPFSSSARTSRDSDRPHQYARMCIHNQPFVSSSLPSPPAPFLLPVPQDSAGPRREVQLTLPDGTGSVPAVIGGGPADEPPPTPRSLARAHNTTKIRPALAAVDGKLWDMGRALPSDCQSVTLLDAAAQDPAMLYTVGHSAAHLLGAAIEQQFPGALLCDGG